MARKKNGAKTATAINAARTKLHKSAGDAVEILTDQLGVFAMASVAALRVWETHCHDPDGDDPEYYLSSARELAEDCVRLGQAIAAIKGESHNHLQHIRVERLAQGEANVAMRETASPAKLLETNAESGQSGAGPGEGVRPNRTSPEPLPRA